MSQLLSKNGKPIIDRATKLPIYTKPVEHRINNIYKELFGMTKREINNVSNNKIADNQLISEIKTVLFAVKTAGIQSSLKSLQLADTQY